MMPILSPQGFEGQETRNTVSTCCSHSSEESELLYFLAPIPVRNQRSCNNIIFTLSCYHHILWLNQSTYWGKRRPLHKMFEVVCACPYKLSLLVYCSHEICIEVLEWTVRKFHCFFDALTCMGLTVWDEHKTLIVSPRWPPKVTSHSAPLQAWRVSDNAAGDGTNFFPWLAVSLEHTRSSVVGRTRDLCLCGRSCSVHRLVHTLQHTKLHQIWKALIIPERLIFKPIRRWYSVYYYVFCPSARPGSNLWLHETANVRDRFS